MPVPKKKDKPSRDVLKIKDEKVTQVEITPTPTDKGPNVTGTIDKKRKGLWLEIEVD